MKKRLRITSILVLTMILLAIVLFGCSQRPLQQTLSKECIRIHIRANSNSEQDQAIKLKVRDEITSYLTSRLEGCKSKAEAKRTLDCEKANLVQIANQALYANNFEYKASIALKKEHFPDKQYGGYDFPEGEYDALIVYLGEGKGDNWWCVAFPPLCFVPNTSNGESVVYKSWVKEMLDKWFAK